MCKKLIQMSDLEFCVTVCTSVMEARLMSLQSRQPWKTHSICMPLMHTASSPSPHLTLTNQSSTNALKKHTQTETTNTHWDLFEGCLSFLNVQAQETMKQPECTLCKAAATACRGAENGAVCNQAGIDLLPLSLSVLSISLTFPLSHTHTHKLASGLLPRDRNRSTHDHTGTQNATSDGGGGGAVGPQAPCTFSSIIHSTSSPIHRTHNWILDWEEAKEDGEDGEM